MLYFLKTTPGRACYNASEPGTGKSLMALEAIKNIELERFLICCPSVVKLNWRDEIVKWRGDSVSIKVIESSKDLKPGNLTWNNFIIASYGLLRREGIAEKFAQYKWGALILDEAHYCVEENTLILTPNGKTSIKNLKVGDEVISFSTNGLRPNRITAIIEADESEDWAILKLSNSSELKALLWHKVLTNQGWKEIKDLEISDKVQVVQKNLGCKIPFLDQEKILQSEVLETLSLPSRRLERADDKEQPYEKERDSRKSKCKIKRNRTQTPYPRGKRETYTIIRSKDEVSSSNSFSRKNSYRFLSDWFRIKTKRLSELLQSGLLCAANKISYRGRWSFTSFIRKKKAGQKEREETTFSRVESITFHKQAGAGKPRLRFIDITVERDENYIAAGIVVHNCKTTTSKTTKAVLKTIWPKASYRICLSGTPFTQGAVDLYTIFSRILPDVFGDYWEFVNRYCIREETLWGVRYTGIQNQEELRKIIRSKFFLRYRKSEVLKELPKRQWIRIPLGNEFKPKETEEDKERRKEYVKALRKAIASRLPPPNPPKHISNLRIESTVAKLKAIHEYIKILLDNETPTIVFFYHLEPLHKFLKLVKDYNPVSIYGDKTDKEREKAIKDFQEGRTNIIVSQITSGGIGVNLFRASTIVFGELDYRASTVEQAIGRAERIGNVHSSLQLCYFVTEKTVDEDIENIVRERGEDHKSLLE